ncbi:MAG: UvrD-helicase domain-containing protein [Acidobacteria bacterium]|nr:UvrD-helicase domain-containing protein [Acidobacteriota bacterium]
MTVVRGSDAGDRGLTPTDGDARALISFALDATLLVEAAAGTGKTTELVQRIVRVIAEGRADVRGIVAVTFTEKAAGELKLRLRQRLEEERHRTDDPGAAARLSAAVQNLEEAHVSTIHGFCADLLRERPVEAGVDPLFRVLTEDQARRLFDQAFEGWLQHQLERPPEGVRRSLRRAGRGFRPGEPDEDGPIERLRRAAYELTEWRDFQGAWAREPFDRAGAVARLVDLVHACADYSANPSYAGDNLFLDTEPVRRLSRELRRRPDPGSPILDPDLDGLEAQLIDLRRNRDFRRARKGSGPTYGKGVTRAQVLEARDALAEALAEFQVRVDADLAAVLHGELLECVGEYERLKAREGAMDFLDLLLRARDLVRDRGDVRAHFQTRFTRIFVDEFQDTDPLQAELLLLLASADPGETDWERVSPVPGKLFIVGDPKQSIYRFRRADVDTYLRVCKQLTWSGARQVELRRSFRSVPNIQRAVNLAFRPVMDGDPEALQARYVPLEPVRANYAGQPSVVALPVPEPYAQRFIAARQIERSLPDAVGAYVEWLINHSGWDVTERRDPEARVPIEARHICILFRRFLSYGEDVTRPYVEALEARGIRHLLVGGRSFHGRDEIETLRAALMAIEWPDDQLSVFATLRGALFAVGDEELLEYYRAARCFHPFRVPDLLPMHLQPIRDALECLAALHRARNRRPVADTIAALLERTRAHVGIVLRPGGEQALANVLHVAELARQYEMDGGMSFRGFVDSLRAEASVRQPAEAPILEEGSDGVRLMTVHKAKGLEFPVVILADLTARLTPFEASRHLDPRRKVCALRIGGWSPKDLNDHRDLELERERAEGERIAYVAATRARDLLVVPAVGDEPYADGWIAPLNKAVYPPETARRHHAAARGCPFFKSRDSVLKRPDGDPASSLTVCPGEHRVRVDVVSDSSRTVTPDGDVTVVWWAPDALALGAQTTFGLRRDDLIVRDVAPAVLRARLDEYTSWRQAREAALASAGKPSVDVVTATEYAGIRDPGSGIRHVDVTIETVSSGDARPGGARFGTLVHALLADAPLGGDHDTVRRLAEVHGRVLGATPEEVSAAGDAARLVLQHPILREAARAASAGVCYRETPVTWRLDDGRLVEGSVDLAFVAGDEVVVVDFKTDRELDGALERYERQVRLYAAAVGAALGRRARAVLMRV